MAYTIAVAGKGGTGKTTFAALTIRYLLNHNIRPILAVDADANSNLNEALGMKAGHTVAQLLEECASQVPLSDGMTKDAFIEYKLEDSLVEGRNIDLLVMGGPEGPGCYCYANNLLRGFINKLSSGYKAVIMDNEAGMEHLSRRTTNDADLLLVISDPTVRGIHAAERIYKVAEGIRLNIKRKCLVVMKTQCELDGPVEGEIARAGLDLIGSVPYDPMVVEYDFHGRPLLDLPDESCAVRAIRTILDKLRVVAG